MPSEKQLLLQQVKAVFNMFRKYILFVIFILISFMVVGAWISERFVTPVYQATAKLYVRPYGEDGNVYAEQMEISKKMAGDCVEIVSSAHVLEKALDNAGVKDEISVEELQKQIYVTTDFESRIVQLIVYDIDQGRAKKIADEICNESVIRIKEILDGDWCSILDQAHVDERPFHPDKVSVILESFLFGFMFLICMFVIFVIMDDKIHSKADIVQYLNINILGEIPKNKSSVYHLNRRQD